MEIVLQQGLPHQQRAVNAVCDVFNGVVITPPQLYLENPQIALSDIKLLENIQSLQKEISPEYRQTVCTGSYLNLDIKMETGTGKTYVYTQTMYELHKRFGINKFIIAVPSLAIKAGTAQFIQDEYTQRHFSDGCGYDADIELCVLKAPTSKKNKRSYFPSEVSNFVKGSSQNARKIFVLLVNMQLLTSNSIRGGRDTGLLWRDDYDYGEEGFYRPFDALRATKPIVIIDEPHRFSCDQKAFKVILNEIKPQCIIRYGATFPERTEGRGKNKTAVKDYKNLVYNLNACESFNLGLIKGVAKEHFEPISRQEEKIKIVSIKSKDSVSFDHIKKGSPKKSFELKTGDSLAIISKSFEGILISAITNSSVEFSNGLTKYKGEEMDVDVYMTSYQEQILRLALERHFETERDNFCNRSFKIKTLALFFIDDISSYRCNASGKTPYLLSTFERLLKERIEITLKTLSNNDNEYRDYLQSSLSDISACHAGYFAQDNNDTDEEIAKEVNAILRGKKQLLSFRNPDGTYNTTRFLFSKWTLKEGWDNPNVFTIAKLRSSGSENSKLQEVGRGLRLPVDENGNRISNEEFLLNYIVDFTESDFAKRLVDQINEEIPQASSVSEDKIKQVAEKLGKTPGALFEELLHKQYIDWQRNIEFDNKSAFFEEYPDFASGVSDSKIKDRNKDRRKTIKIRKAVYDEIREFWERINQRYLLFYDAELNGVLESVVLSLFEKEGVFTDVVMNSTRESIHSVGKNVEKSVETGVQYIITNPISYGSFLTRIMRGTNIPITTLNKAFVQYCRIHGTISEDKINERSASAFCAEFQDWKVQNLQGRFRYVRSNTSCGATSLTYSDGTPRKEITQGRIGTKILSGTPSDKYLYDSFAYDSPLEKDNLTATIEEVVVYGKIPRSSIAIPTITGSMYSPDFMYVVKKASGEKELNIVVETKDVEGQSVLRANESAKIACARVFFEILSQDGYKVHFRTQLSNKQVAQIIKEVMDENPCYE